MKKRYSRLARLLASGLVTASIAAPTIASAAINPNLIGGGGVLIGGGGGVVGGGGVLVPVEPDPVWVTSPADLVQKLNDPSVQGRVIIPWHVQWDMSAHAPIHLRSGIQLVGERGPLGRRPLLYTDYKAEKYSLFEIKENNVSVEGIHFRGPANSNRQSSQEKVAAIHITQDPVLKLGRGITIANNEFNEWTNSCVEVESNHSFLHPEEAPAGAPRILPSEAGLVRIVGNYMHHNAREGAGYGVNVSDGGYATIEGNVFDYNRHAVASDGAAFTGYVARFNYVLQGGFKQGDYYNQHFDVHGTGLDSQGNNTGYGATAGEFYDISFNTIRGEQGYYLVKTRPAFMLRGKTTMGSHFNGNIAVHDDLDAAVSLKMDKGDWGIGEDHKRFNFHAAGNRFNTDYSGEIAMGDFDKDGRADVFVANGTAWFYSPGGVRPWQFLRASDKRTHELGFADIDNDGITDVLYRDGSGNLGTMRAGLASLVNFTTVPVLMKDLRFGDFNGDGKTDIFYTLNGQWWIWYGHTRAWTAAQTSGVPISELLFGEFDGVRGTDVAAVANGGWSYSGGGVAAWTRMNARLRTSFASAVAADFDGNGLSDIAFSDGQEWVYSRDGRSALVSLRNGNSSPSYSSLKQLLIGRFDGGRSAKVVTFDRERLVIWNGLGSSQAFSMLSEQNMR